MPSQPTPPTVRPATAADVPGIGRAMARAFDGDPVWAHISPPSSNWVARATAFFEVEARAKLAGEGEVLVAGDGPDDVRGAAIWAAPDHWKPTLREAVAIVPPSIRLFRTQLPRAISALTRIEKLHPAEPPHWYLAILATDPAHQGQGVGGALVRAVTERCDEQGLPAYLESSKERNVPFYARLGFAVVEEVHLPAGGPPIWRMWRDPKG